MTAKINFFKEDTAINQSNKFIEDTRHWIEEAIIKESKKVGDINIIYCKKQYLLEINRQYLSHDYHTDIITFNYNAKEVISGDLFLGVDIIKDNAKGIDVSFEQELNRVIIHGILHLIGYNDKTNEQAKEIRAKENFYLTLHPKRK